MPLERGSAASGAHAQEIRALGRGQRLPAANHVAKRTFTLSPHGDEF